MKNYFIVNGEVLSISVSIEGMESQVQESLDGSTSGITQFRTKEISEKEVRMFSVRGFNCDPDKLVIPDAGMALITGVGIGVFQPQQVGGYPVIYSLSFTGKDFYAGIINFVRFYRFQLFEEIGQTVKYIGLRCYSNRILMQIIFQNYERQNLAKRAYSIDLIDRGYSIGGIGSLKAAKKFLWGYHYQPTL